MAEDNAFKVALAEVLTDPDQAEDVLADRMPLVLRRQFVETVLARASAATMAEGKRRRAAQLDRLRRECPTACDDDVQRIMAAFDEAFQTEVSRQRNAAVGRLNALILHPAAAEHWATACDLFGADIPVSKAVAALNALAGSGGGKSQN